MEKLNLLAIDIGGGTQDILIYDSSKTIENCYQLVIPSQTVIVARKIMKATQDGKDICLTGKLMGGGASVKAIMNHLEKGYKVFSLPEPAKTIKDNLEIVKKKGITIVDDIPQNVIEIEFKDVDLNLLQKSLDLFEIEMPTNIAVAVQDHGESLEISNRVFRFQHLERFILSGGLIENLSYPTPPDYMTRMKAVKEEIPSAVLMDTGPAAVRGALLDEKVKKYVERGLVVVNIGNQHTFAVLIKGNKVYGMFEHHTKFMTPEKLKSLIETLQNGTLKNETVFNDKGHGAVISEDYFQQEKFNFVTVTGPNRVIAKDLGYHMAVPFGDMMIAGCFGLVEAFKDLKLSNQGK